MGGNTRSREKLNNATLFRPDVYQKFLADTPKGRVISPATVSDKFKVSASLARRALKDMARKKLIKRVVTHQSLYLYTRTDEEAKAAAERAIAQQKAEEEA